MVLTRVAPLLAMLALSPPSSAHAQSAPAEEATETEPAEEVRCVSGSTSPCMRVTFGVGAPLNVGMMPGLLASGLAVSVGLRVDDWSAALIGAFEHSFLQVLEDSGDQLAARMIEAGPQGCYHFEPGIVCLGTQLGSFQARRQNNEPESQGALSLTVDARGGVEISEGIFLMRIFAELRVPVLPFEMVIDGASVWTMPPVSGGLRLLIGASIW